MRSVQASTLITVQQALTSNVTLLEYYVAPTQTFAFVVTRDNFHVVSISVTRQAMNDFITGFRQFHSLEGVPQASQELNDLLFAPVREYIHTTLLYIAPHSILHYLPFGALHDGRRYLVEDYATAYIPSAGALQYVLENAEVQRNKDVGYVLVFGNPATDNPNWASMIYAEQEAERIAVLFNTQAITGSNATETRLVAEAPQADVIHIAAAGGFNPIAPLFSRIYLTPDDKNDGYLEVYEVYNLNLSKANLVVLSSNETHLGELSAGDELVGLTRAFLYAGTPSVVSSLWAVDDAATALLMEQFYTHLRDGMNKAEALRQAQIDIQAQYPSPYYWAGFVLTGDYSSLFPHPPPARGLPWPWLLAGILATLVVIGAAVVSLRRYPAYAAEWTAAKEYPLQQMIPLIAPVGERIDAETLCQKLRVPHAFSTRDQVQNALDGLVERGLMQREGDAYRYVSPWTARVHCWMQNKHISGLAERIRTQHPLYTRTRDFFTQARFHLQELGAEEFLFIPQGQEHPQALYGSVYTRLIAGRPPTGDDFTAICEAAQQYYGEDMAHRVALVISDRRPEPGARYRLYEIRQREGLAIVPLDVSLFGQIKPNRTAGDILAAEIDQATGQQNLYGINSPVSGDLSFFGRERVLQEVIDLLDAGQPVGVFGLRKVGKTSLIQRLQGRLGQRRPIAFVDTQGTVRQQGVWPLYRAIVAAFVGHLGLTRPDLVLPDLRLYSEAGPFSPAMAESFLQDLRALHIALGQPGEKERMLLIVDEIDRLLPSGAAPGYEGFAAFFGQLRAANQQARILDFLVVGVDQVINRRERWQYQDNELYRALREVWMPPMVLEDAREMIESLGSQMGVRYESDALRLLARAGGGQPFVTRQMCSLAVEDRLGKGAITVTADQAQAAIEEYISRDPYLGEMWRTRLDEAQREMLRTLAQASAPLPDTRLLPAAQRQKALAALGALEQFTLIRRDEGGHVIAWDVFRDWIRWVELGLEE